MNKAQVHFKTIHFMCEFAKLAVTFLQKQNKNTL